MATLKDLRRRIKSIKGTSQITKAMELVAAAKMKKAQDKAQKGLPYLDQLQKLLGKLSQRVDTKLNPLLSDSKGTKTGVLLITTNKGLCGSINTNLIKYITTHYDIEKTVFYTVGRKGRTFLAKTGRELKADFETADSPEIIETNSIGKLLTDDFIDDKINKIEVVYSHFVNTAVQKASKFDLLPLSSLPTPDTDEGSEVDYEYEPNAHDILSGILPHYISYTIYQLILESRASEHSSRMVAMKNATDNAKEIIKQLTLEYNKARQAQITNQILEISSAAAAMQK